VVVVGFALVALFADCLAGDRPLAMRRGGELYLAPHWIDHGDLAGERGTAISESLDEGDWALWPPVRRSPTEVRTDGSIDRLSPPSSEHWLGTDDRGRDVLARLIHGTRSTLRLAAIVSLAALGLGLGLALVGAGGGRPLAAVVAAAADSAVAIPAIVLVVAAQGLWGGASLAAVAALLVIPRAAEVAQIAGAGLERALALPFCDAARASGAGRARVLLRHALPNVTPQLLVATAITASITVLAEAALSFLGFGTPPPAASWGELLAQAHANDLRWWLLAPPGLAVVALAGALGALGRRKSM
jgi:peptide/nickel transport system permease protein